MIGWVVESRDCLKIDQSARSHKPAATDHVRAYKNEELYCVQKLEIYSIGENGKKGMKSVDVCDRIMWSNQFIAFTICIFHFHYLM